jgi:2-oxoisovalerate dehydrogenase E1 component
LNFKEEIDAAVIQAFNDPSVTISSENELLDMYAQAAEQIIATSDNKTNKRFLDAISDAMKQAMRKHSNLVIMGQDVAEYGGAFKITEGFVEEFGKERVRNTPLCESAIVGAAMGLAINHHKAIMEMQFADFVTVAFNQIVNNLA